MSTDDPHTGPEPELEFEDDGGEAAVAWQHLPLEREFFATPYDPPVKALVQEIRDGDLVVRPLFQRYSVWDTARQSRFIESILLNIPIPNLFFAEDEDQTRVVVDGQQRLTALRQFLDDKLRLKSLEVLAPLNGKSHSELTPRQQKLIGNRTLRCLVISSKSEPEIRFQVFERLNQGGVPLNAQEVRHCVYRGSFNDLLHELASHPDWLSALGESKPHMRMSDCELILRFFALRDTLPHYSPPLKSLLNEFMRSHRHVNASKANELRAAFFASLTAVQAAFGPLAFRRLHAKNSKLTIDQTANRAVFDVQMLLMEGLDATWASSHARAIQTSFAKLCLSDTQFMDAVSKATADRTRLRRRLQRWRETLLAIGAQLPNSGRADIPQDD